MARDETTIGSNFFVLARLHLHSAKLQKVKEKNKLLFARYKRTTKPGFGRFEKNKTTFEIVHNFNLSTRLLYGTIRRKVGTFHENRKEHVCALRTFKSSLTGKMIFFKRLRTNTILVRDFTVYTHIDILIF